MLTHDLTLGKSACIFDNSVFLGWNCDIGIGWRKRCLIFGWVCLVMQAEYGMSFASFHNWVTAATQRVRLGQYIDLFLKSIQYILVRNGRSYMKRYNLSPTQRTSSSLVTNIIPISYPSRWPSRRRPNVIHKLTSSSSLTSRTTFFAQPTAF